MAVIATAKQSGASPENRAKHFAWLLRSKRSHGLGTEFTDISQKALICGGDGGRDFCCLLN